MGCGGSKEKTAKKNKDENKDAEKQSVATENPEYGAGDQDPREKSLKKTTDSNVGAKKTPTNAVNDQAAGSAADDVHVDEANKSDDEDNEGKPNANPNTDAPDFPHSEYTPLNREGLFPDDQNEKFGIRVGEDKYANLELHSLHSDLYADDDDARSYASAEFMTAVSAGAGTSVSGYSAQGYPADFPPPKPGPGESTVFKDADSSVEAESQAFATPFNRDDETTVSMQTNAKEPHGFEYYNNNNNVNQATAAKNGSTKPTGTSTPPPLGPHAEPAQNNNNNDGRKFERKSSLTVTQVRNNSVTASLHGEIPPSPYQRTFSQNKSLNATKDRGDYEPYGADADEQEFQSCRSLATPTPPVSARYPHDYNYYNQPAKENPDTVTFKRRLPQRKSASRGGSVRSEPRKAKVDNRSMDSSKAPARSEDFYSIADAPSQATSAQGGMAVTKGPEGSSSSSDFSPPEVGQETRLPADRTKASGRETASYQGSSTPASEAGSRHTKEGKAKSSSRHSASAPDSAKDSPRRPTAAYVPEEEAPAVEESEAAAASLSDMHSDHSFKTAVSAQTMATTAHQPQQPPAPEVQLQQEQEGEDEDAMASPLDVHSDHSFKTAVSAQTQATTRTNATSNAKGSTSIKAADTPKRSSRNSSIVVLSPVPKPPTEDDLLASDNANGNKADKAPSNAGGSTAPPSGNTSTVGGDTNASSSKAAKIPKRRGTKEGKKSAKKEPTADDTIEDASDVHSEGSFKTAVSAQTQATTVKK